MDNAALFGEEFHRLGFGDGVPRLKLLSDYKVLVLAIDEGFADRFIQRLMADSNNEIPTPDAVKIIGCWQGLAKKFGTKHLPRQFEAEFRTCAPQLPSRGKSQTPRSSLSSYPNCECGREALFGRTIKTFLKCELWHVSGKDNAPNAERLPSNG